MSLAAYVERTLARVRATRVGTPQLSAAGAPASLFSGAAGVSFFCVECAELSGDRRQGRALARAWLELAESSQTSVPAGERATGLLVGELGIAYVDVRLRALERDASGVRGAVDRMARLARGLREAEGPSSELVGGLAGVVQGARTLAAGLPKDVHAESRQALEEIAQACTSTMSARACASRASTGADLRLGVAHGIAGELLVLVRCLGPHHDAVAPRLAALRALQRKDDEGFVYWPGTASHVDASLVASWCTGVAGHTLLWSEVARQTGTRADRDLAAECARTTAFVPSGHAGLCCGLAGQSIALQRFADLSGDPRYARRAYERLVRATALADRDRSGDLLLWKGALGVALAALARLRGERLFPVLGV